MSQQPAAAHTSRLKQAATILKNGILTENPVLRLVLGMCPTLAVTTSAFNGIGMGLSVLFVLTCSNILISSLRNFIPNGVRIPAYIVIIATFSTLVQMLCEAFVPALYDSLGIYLPLIVVNCIILGRAEAFASKQPVWCSALDGIGMGLGFTAALFIIASLREILGAGSFFGFSLGWSQPMKIFLAAPGGFFALGTCMAVFNAIMARKEAKK